MFWHDENHAISVCLTSLFYNCNVPALRNCHFKSILSVSAPQTLYRASAFCHVISRARHLAMNNTDSHGTRISTADCQACVIRPGSSKLSLNHGDLVLNRDMDYSKTRPEAFGGKVHLTPLSQKMESVRPPEPSSTCILTARYASLTWIVCLWN